MTRTQAQIASDVTLPITSVISPRELSEYVMTLRLRVEPNGSRRRRRTPPEVLPENLSGFPSTPDCRPPEEPANRKGRPSRDRSEWSGRGRIEPDACDIRKPRVRESLQRCRRT